MNQPPSTCSLSPTDGEGCCGSCEPDARKIASGRALAGTAALASVGAVAACAACCVLPLAFPVIAATAVGGLLAWFGQGQYLLTGLAVLLVAASWLWVWRQSRRGRVARGTLWLMGLASVVTLVALAWPLAEPYLMSALAPGGLAQPDQKAVLRTLH